MKLTSLVLVLAGAAYAAEGPIASRITVGSPDANYLTVVNGAAGAVEPDADVALVTLETGHYATTRAAADGSFSASIFAPRGASILVKSDPQRAFVKQIAEASPPLIQGNLSQLVSLQGTIVRVAVPADAGGIAFAAAGIDPIVTPWIAEGTIAKLQFAPGESSQVNGTYTLIASTLSSASNPRFGATLTLELLSDANGTPVTAWSVFDSAVMTPTGLPIERVPSSPSFGSANNVALVVDGSKATGAFSFQFTVPADLRPGTYLMRIGFGVQGVPTPPIDQTARRTSFISNFRGRENMATVAVVRVGTPAAPRLPAVLLMNDLSEGHRGAVAVDDRERYAPANHVVTASDAMIVPRTDARTGAARVYRLDPFAVTLGASDRGGKTPAPLVPLRFPSGSLKATVRAPSGTTRVLGPVPTRQFRLVGPATVQGHTMEGGPHITDATQLATLDPSFDISFAEDGRHVVTLDGTVDDLWGNAWRVGGTYEIDAARPLVIDSAVIPMTSFEVADAIAPAVQIIPPVAADVELRVRLGSRTASFSGKANRFGIFTPAGWFGLADAGEYRIDVTASFREPNGVLWMGTRTWGGVVAPRDTPIIAHGRRGIDQQKSEKQQWYFRTQTGDPIGGSHVQFAFHSGDVMWLQESDSAIPVMTVQDPLGVITPSLIKLHQAMYPGFGQLSQQVTIGEIPLFSGNLSGRDPSLTGTADGWSYSYAAVERPLVRVREVIAEDHIQAYWRFSDRYARQSGSGANGDLPNDFKFQFGGVVLRGPLFDPPRYAIYGSLFVLVADADPGGGTRVFPPFDRNGGPLFSLKGKAIEMFFHPTAVKPGTVLVQGDRVSFAGYAAPMLAAKITIDVTSPSGRVRTIKGQANKIGWFYQPGFDFTADEPGVWKARARITFDGATSAGPLQPPFPTGDVLGSREGEFNFYVVRGDAAPLALASMPRFKRPIDGPITFTVAPPAGLTNVQVAYTTTIPGFILEEGTTAAMTYSYDAQRLASDFPNLDLHDHDDAGGADLVTISLLLSGTDAAGVRRHFGRQVVLNGDELLMPEQPAAPAAKRRRATRR
jgi:hypothetical protein